MIHDHLSTGPVSLPAHICFTYHTRTEPKTRHGDHNQPLARAMPGSCYGESNPRAVPLAATAAVMLLLRAPATDSDAAG